jgi:CubicO group peptidase (beta-lactamase class C family)
MTSLPRAREVLERALAERAFSAVSAEIGRSAGPLWTHAAGTLGFGSQSPRVNTSTIFDLASLTKVLATTTIALWRAARNGLHLDAAVRDVIQKWTAADRAAVTLRDLLEHASGLPAHREYHRTISGREAYVAAIAAEPLEYTPRSQAVYSDLGFMMLGFVLERHAGTALDLLFSDWRSVADIESPLSYRPPDSWRDHTAQTENDPWRGRVLQGEVHDENAAALDGVAAHAGLFGTAAAVAEVARWWMARFLGHDDPRTGVPAALAREFARRSVVRGSSRALGWDTMLTTSSCGTRMSARAVGHTGFTGTSLWIDPEQDYYFVLLTNRVHPSRDNTAIQSVRRAFHDAALLDLASID